MRWKLRYPCSAAWPGTDAGLRFSARCLSLAITPRKVIAVPVVRRRNTYAYGPDAAAMVAGAREKGMEHAYAFDDQTALVAALREDAKKGDALLFKGSRGMRMERALAMFLGEEVEA